MNTFTLQLILVTMLAYRSQYGSVIPRHHESFAVICICYDEKWTVYRIIYRMDEKSGVEWENDFA